jgi:DNA topoisomerase-2
VCVCEIDEGSIKSFKEHHTDLHVDFTIECTEENMAQFEKHGLEKSFGLIGSCSVSNMVLFRADGTLKRYNDALEILCEWYKNRKPYYAKRKEWMIQKLNAEHKRISNKLRFILAVIADELKIRNIKKQCKSRFISFSCNNVY